VLPANDYSEYMPLNKRQVDMNNIQHQKDPMNPKKLHSDLTAEEKRQAVDYKDSKQAQLQDHLSSTKYQAPPKPAEAPKPTPAKGKTAAENAKL